MGMAGGAVVSRAVPGARVATFTKWMVGEGPAMAGTTACWRGSFEVPARKDRDEMANPPPINGED